MSEKKWEVTLWKGIDLGRLELVAKSLSKGANINCIRNGKTPLAVAVEKNHLEIVQLCNLADFVQSEQPLLHRACKSSLECVKYLFESHGEKVDINAVNLHGETALAMAVDCGKTDIVDYLLMNGADIDKLEKDAWTPLSKASYNRNLELVKKLVDKGADINCCDGDGCSALSNAALRDQTEIVKYLVSKGADVNLFQVEKENGRPPLSWASGSSLLEMVKLLVAHGANVNQIDSEGNTALMRALINNAEDVVEYLLTQEADVCKMVDKSKGEAPLSVAVQKCDLSVVQLLLENGAKMSIPQAFLKAIECGKLEMVTYLHKQGASINVKHRNGDTPLKKSIEKGNSEICEYLINNGANVSVLEENYKILNVFKYLEKNDIQMAKLIIQMNTNLDLTLESGDTVLNKFVEMESYSKVKFLVEQGADVNKIDDNKRTALGIAASMYSVRIATFLIDSDADISLAMDELQKFGECNGNFDIYLQTVICNNKTLSHGGGQEEAH